jgi:hypothetical protein
MEVCYPHPEGKEEEVGFLQEQGSLFLQRRHFSAGAVEEGLFFHFPSSVALEKGVFFSYIWNLPPFFLSPFHGPG